MSLFGFAGADVDHVSGTFGFVVGFGGVGFYLETGLF